MGLSAGWGSNWRGAFPQEHRIATLDRQWQAWNEAGIPVVRVDMADPMAWNTPARVAEDRRRRTQRFLEVEIANAALDRREFHCGWGRSGRGDEASRTVALTPARLACSRRAVIASSNRRTSSRTSRRVIFFRKGL
jgi:hypothetical protein